MTFSFSQRSIDRMEGVDARLVSVAKRAIEISKVDFGIPEGGGVRTAEQQNALFKNGASKADGRIKKSKHQTGKALDVYAYVNGKASWKEEHLAEVAAAMKKAAAELGHSIEWGGDWKSFRDMPHFQINS